MLFFLERPAQQCVELLDESSGPEDAGALVGPHLQVALIVKVVPCTGAAKPAGRSASGLDKKKGVGGNKNVFWNFVFLENRQNRVFGQIRYEIRIPR